ncbi:MAG: xanthine dehydrogenase small subunit [Beijerinckiaceae bacterium]
MRDHISFIFRGERRELKGFPPVRTLLDWLREDERVTGTKEGCNEGDCGACTVVLVRLEGERLVHRPVNACITFLGMIDGAEVLTIEDLKKDGRLHPIQQAMVDHHGSQCGFCTPGIVMALFALGKEEGPVTRERINDQLAGNLCRCTGYRPIVDAAMVSLNDVQPDHPDRQDEERIKALMALDDAGVAVVADKSPHPEPDEGSGSAVYEASGASVDRLGTKLGESFFAAPRDINELCSLYAAHPDATILAGATDVGLWITKQFRPIRKLIWLGRVDALKAIDDTPERLVLGAGVTHEAVLPALGAISPDLAELGRRFGSTQVRAQGTVGGNIANGSPIGDWAPAFIALGAAIELMSGLQRRTLPLEDFFIAYGKQDRQTGEIVESLTIPKPATGQHFRCLKISKRFDEDISALMGAFLVTVVDGVVTTARVAFGGMAATPKRAPRTEAALLGARLNERGSWEHALDALGEDYQPIGDMRASARYRAETARALLTKALIEIGGGNGTRIAAPSQTLKSSQMEATHAA